MFTGLIQAVGEVVEFSGGLLIVSDPQASSSNPWPGEPWREGESIAVNGCCLTRLFDARGLRFDLSEETLASTAYGRLRPGAKVNLERAMKLEDRLGGHIVQGHVDAVGRCLDIEELPGSWTFRFEAPGGARYLIDKGSISIDGISLTVVDPIDDIFSVAVIPHTFRVTSFGQLSAGDLVNVEYDVLAKHIEKLIAFR